MTLRFIFTFIRIPLANPKSHSVDAIEYELPTNIVLKIMFPRNRNHVLKVLTNSPKLLFVAQSGLSLVMGVFAELLSFNRILIQRSLYYARQETPTLCEQGLCQRDVRMPA